MAPKAHFSLGAAIDGIIEGYEKLWDFNIRAVLSEASDRDLERRAYQLACSALRWRCPVPLPP